jgi:hypothetical protein
MSAFAIVQEQSDALSERDRVVHEVARLTVYDRFDETSFSPGDDGYA